MSLIESVQPTLDKLNKRIQNEGLKDLTYLDYDRYLNTALWGKIKNWIYERDSRTCRICSAKGKLVDLDVHHRSYDLDVLEGRNEGMLVTLCRRCHTLVEHYPDGRRRYDLEEKDTEYFRLIEVHTRMFQQGIPLQVESKITARSHIVALRHEKCDALVFTSIESLLFHYAMAVYHTHRDRIRIPMPFGRDRFYQKSGGKFLDRASGKVLMSIKIKNGEGLINISTATELPFYEALSKVLDESVWCVNS